MKKEDLRLLDSTSASSLANNSSEILNVRNQTRKDGEDLNSVQLEEILKEQINKLFEDQKDFNEEQKGRVEEIRRILEPLDKIILGRDFKELGFDQEVVDTLKIAVSGYLKEEVIIIGERSFRNVIDECALQLRGKVLNCNYSKDQLNLYSDVCEQMAEDINKKLFQHIPSKRRSSSFASIGKISDMVYEPYFSGGYINVLLSKVGILPKQEDKDLNVTKILTAIDDVRFGSESIFSCNNPNINLLSNFDQRYSDKLFTIRLDSSYAEPEAKNYLEDNKYFFRKISEDILNSVNKSNFAADNKSNQPRRISPATSFINLESSILKEEKKKEGCCTIL